MDGAAFCRGCLNRHADPDDLVPYTEKTRRQFVYCTGLQVKKSDTFTFQLCKECYANMKTSCKFKKQCRSSDKQFKKYIGLKECGATEDFAAFLAKDDDEFRFPYINGEITPSYQRPTEDDNESTNTSIRNFMTTLVKAEDLPETEARIVNEVIVEEADILDDSLDSLWLQDDPLMDADLNIDISLSAFSTPRICNEDRYLMPRMVDEPTNTETNAVKPNFGTRYKPKVYADFIVAPDVDAVKNEPESTKSTIPPRQTLKSMPDIDSIVTEENVPAFGLRVVELERMQDNDNIPEDSIDNDLKMTVNVADPLSLSGLLAYPSNTGIALPSPSKSIKSILFGPSHEANVNDIGESSPTTEQLLWPQPIKNIPFKEELSQTGEQDPTESYTDTVDEILKEASANLEVYDEPIKLNFYVDTQQDIGSPGYVEPDVVVAKNRRDPYTVNRETYQCPICHEEIQHESYFKRHLSKHEITSKLYCKICCILFTDRIEKRQHSQVVHQKVRNLSFECNQCGKKFYDSSNHKRHLLTHEKKEESFICDLCDRSISTKAKLLLHLRSHPIFKNLPHDSFARNRDVVYKERQCLICGITVKGQNYYSHIKTHNESLHSHQCFLCKRTFYRRIALVHHMAAVHGSSKETHKCFKCDLIFASTLTLSRHIQRMHTTETCFTCNECNGEFPSKKELRSHLFSAHDFNRRKEDALKKIKCAHCAQMFHSIRAVNVHVTKSKKCLKLRNEKIKVFKCQYCDATFMRQGDLNIHMKNTQKCLTSRSILKSDVARKITCAHCEKVFNTVKGLNIHINKHCLKLHNNKPDLNIGFTCTYCNAKFIRNTDLKFHIINTAKCLALRNIGITSEIQCRFCNRFAGAGNILKKHTNNCAKSIRIKSLTDTGYYKCIFCSNTFHMFKLLARHMKTSAVCIASRENNEETQSHEDMLTATTM